MKKLLLASLLVLGCHSKTTGALPPREGSAPVPELTLVWVGEGRAERMEGGTWKRAETFDYEFTVEQRRFRDHWESVKHQRRRHPAYDGSAGPREITMFFRLDFGSPDTTGKVSVSIDSSLGKGEGRSDREFRVTELVMHPDLSRFAPFDTYRIGQQYEYEKGTLTETVSLDKGTTPWVRNLESATLFAPHRFETAPTHL